MSQFSLCIQGREIIIACKKVFFFNVVLRLGVHLTKS